MIQLIYASKTVKDVDLNKMLDILDNSMRNNALRYVTGMLIWDRQICLQCLEGDEDTVLTLMEGIKEDKRHYCVNIIGFEHIEERAFSDWSMGFLNSAGVIKDIVFKHTGCSELEPSNYTFDQALAILLDASSKI